MNVENNYPQLPTVQITRDEEQSSSHKPENI